MVKVKVKVKVHRIDPTRTIHTISKWQEELSKLIILNITSHYLCQEEVN